MSGSWRKYTFFEKDVVSESLSEALGCSVTALVAEGGILLFGDENGRITVTGRDFSGSQEESTSKNAKQVFKGPVHSLFYLFDSKNHSKQYIIAIGEENPNFVPKTNPFETESSDSASTQSFGFTTIKIFNAADLNRPLQAFSASYPGLPSSARVTSTAVVSDGSQIAVGYSNGGIVLFVNAFLKDGPPSSRSAPAHVLIPEHGHPVTAIFFCEFPSLKTPNENQIRMYTVFDTDLSTGSEPSILSEIGGITVFDVSTSINTSGIPTLLSARKSPNILDERGAARFCSCFVKDTKELVIGRSEGIFSYSVEDRGGAAGFEGEKQCVSAIGRYILVASLDDKSRRTNITIYDLRNKFISFSGQIAAGERVASVAHDGGMAYILTTSQLLLRYRERDTASKVEVLLKKSLYSLAISLATEEQSDVTEIMKLYKQYGDHLYKKGDFDAAMTQFISTIGYLQSSYVIRRYLEPHRMFNLTTYLEKIMERGLANKEHKTLLLTCYTKLKDEEKIKSFLNLHNASYSATKTASSSAVVRGSLIGNISTAPVVSATGLPIDTNLDSEACVSVLSNSDYIDYALQLAASCGLHSTYLDLQITKCGDAGAEAALVYFACLSLVMGHADFLPLLMEYLPVLLDLKESATTGLLIKLCKGDVASIQNIIIESKGSVTNHVSVIQKMNGLPSDLQGHSVILPLEDLMDVYVDHEKYLKILIEGVYSSSDAAGGNRISTFHNRVLPHKVMNALLELYLEDYKRLKELTPSADKQEVKSVEAKVMALLDGHPGEYDLDRALVLMHTFNFNAGTRYLLERTLSTPLLVRMCIESGDDRGLIKILRREGAKDSDLYVQILTHFVTRSSSKDNNEDDKWDAVEEVMSLIEKESVLAPAQVISILCLNADLPFEIASHYIFKVAQDLKDVNTELEANVSAMRHTIASVATEDSARKQLSKLSGYTNAHGNVVKKTKRPYSRSTSGTISRTGTHDEEEDEEDDHDAELHKRERAAEQKKWESIMKAQADRANDHESFYAELEHSVDGFSTIASYFGKTVILDTNNT